MPDPINPDEIPADLLKPEEVESTARRIKQLGRATADQGAALQRTWHGLAHHYEAPESHALLTIMDPVKTNTHGFSENTTTVAKALTAYAIEEERVKLELDRIKKQAETFVAAVAGGVTRRHEVPKGGPVSEKVPWHEDQGSIDTNNALLAQIDAQLTALREAQERCANTVYDIIGFPHPGNPVGAGGPRPAAPGPSVQAMPWGAPAQRTERCGEKVVSAYRHYAWNGLVVGGAGEMLEGVALANAMTYAGYNPTTGELGDQNMYLKPLDQLVRTATGAFLWLSPTTSITVANTRGPIRRYLESSKATAQEAGMSMIAWDTWKRDPFAAAGTSAFNISTLFIPGVGETSVGIKVTAQAGKAASAAFKVEHLVPLDAYASSAADASRLRAQLVGEEISSGHAFAKHVIEQGEFPQITTRSAFASEIERVVNHGERRSLERGREAYWHNGTVVVRNPRAPDGGTAFRPTQGYRYFTKGLH